MQIREITIVHNLDMKFLTYFFNVAILCRHVCIYNNVQLRTAMLKIYKHEIRNNKEKGLESRSLANGAVG